MHLEVLLPLDADVIVLHECGNSGINDYSFEEGYQPVDRLMRGLFEAGYTQWGSSEVAFATVVMTRLQCKGDWDYIDLNHGRTASVGTVIVEGTCGGQAAQQEVVLYGTHLDHQSAQHRKAGFVLNNILATSNNMVFSGTGRVSAIGCGGANDFWATGSDYMC